MRFAGTELSNYLGGTMDYSGLGKVSQEGRSLERRANMTGDALIGNAGNQSLSKIKQAEYGAEAIVAEGAAAGQSAMFDGIAKGIGGLAGGFGSRGGSGITSYDDIGSDGLRGVDAGGATNAYMGTGGKYGSLDTSSVDNAIDKYILNL